MLKLQVFHFLLTVLGLSASVFAQQGSSPAENWQWIRPDDPRLEWINVASWEQRAGGLQPVRVPKVWRDKFSPPATAFRALSAAGMTVRFRTDSQEVILRFSFIDAPERLGITPEIVWEPSRPPYFDVYRDGKFLANVPGKIHFYQQDIVLFDGSAKPPSESEFTVLLPHYYWNAEIMIKAIGMEKDARVLSLAPDRRPVVLFHGDSITHGHGVTTPREPWVWQAREMANCRPLNLGFGGSAWTDTLVAKYIASRSDWDELVLLLGTNSFGGRDAARKPETLEQYEKKYNAFLAAARSQFPEKPILCITPILSHADIAGAKNPNGDSPQAYRDAIQRVVERRQKTDRNLDLMDGLKLIDNPIYLLPTDQIHPNMAGSMRIAEHVAAALKPILTGLKSSSVAVLATPAWSNTVRVDGGLVSGAPGVNPKIQVYKGIPYAAPPVGDLRWRPPQRVPAWDGVRKAAQFSLTCMQPERAKDSVYYPGYEPTGEDCLYLNVWTPAKTSKARLPVMVYIHGGGFRVVSGSEKYFNGEALAKRGVIVVTFNYRLGPFGFLAHSELSKESDHHVSGNYGMLDQIAALEWVQRNIAAFGGDPKRVTIFGQSAGADSVCDLLVSPLAKGLYIHAIGESVVDCFEPPEEETDLAAAERAGEKFLTAARVQSIAELRTRPAEYLLKTAAQFTFRPIIDGYFLPASPWVIYRRGQENVVDVLIGSNADEGTLLGSRFPGTASAWLAQARHNYGDLADGFLKVFPAESDAQAKAANLTLWRDRVAFQARMITRMMAGTGKVKAYRYYFSRKPPIPNGMFREQATHELGAFHSSELEYVFHNLDTRPYEWTEIDRKLSDLMSAYWVNFAKTGNPNGRGLPNWPSCDARNDLLMEFGDRTEVHSGFDRAALEFLESAVVKKQPGD